MGADGTGRQGLLADRRVNVDPKVRWGGLVAWAFRTAAVMLGFRVDRGALLGVPGAVGPVPCSGGGDPTLAALDRGNRYLRGQHPSVEAARGGDMMLIDGGGLVTSTQP